MLGIATCIVFKNLIIVVVDFLCSFYFIAKYLQERLLCIRAFLITVTDKKILPYGRRVIERIVILN